MTHASHIDPAPDSGSLLALSARWERPVVASTGDRTALMLRITTGPALVAAHERAPIDLAVALDRSGSMRGTIGLAKEAVLIAIDHLDERDRIAVVAFDDRLETVQPLAFATPEIKAALRAALASIDARGGTYLSGGWLLAGQQLAAAERQTTGEGRVQRSLLVTDGRANVGITDGGELAHHAGQLRMRGISTSAIGLGRGFDEFLLSGMVEAGGGAFAFAAQASELDRFFAGEIGDLLDAVALQPILQLTWPEGLKARLVNAFPVNRVGRTHTVDLRILRSEDDQKLLFTVTSAPDVDGALVAHARLDWTDARTRQRMTTVADTDPLLCVDPAEAATFSKDPEVAEALALEEAAKAHREAVRLDREGRFQESRQVFAASRRMLSHAPQSDEVREQIRVSMDLSNAPMAPLDEEVRKERVAYHSQHSRGTGTPRPPRPPRQDG
ncbi:MAG TPA: VWA domain-containing protein [Thermomicrobiales bacterium]|nr:VWA domain-containing protein [Thermomicrobiales bacterium]